MPDPPKRPRQPSQPKLEPIFDSVGEDAVGKRQDRPHRTTLTELPAVGSPARKQTLNGLQAPGLPPELRPTAPASALSAPTVRVTPATGIRIPPDETRATGQQGASLAPPSVDPKDAQILALRARAEAAEKEKAELERQARVKAESAGPATYPPPVVAAAPVPVVAPIEPATEAVIAWLVKRGVDNRKAIYALIAAMGIGGGGVAIKSATEKPQPAPLTAAQLDAALDKLKTRKGGLDDQVRMQNEMLQLTKCMRRKMNQIGESVLPAPDHMGNVRKPQPFEDDCMDSPKPLPDP